MQRDIHTSILLRMSKDLVITIFLKPSLSITRNEKPIPNGSTIETLEGNNRVLYFFRMLKIAGLLWRSGLVVVFQVLTGRVLINSFSPLISTATDKRVSLPKILSRNSNILSFR